MKIDNFKIFISYSRKDSEEFAERLSNDLRLKGLNVWLDKTDIQPGELWDNAIENALESSGQFLIILSPESVSSINVMDELNYALEEDKTIIPVLFIDCKIPFRIRRRQYCDFRNDYNTGIDELLKGGDLIKDIAKENQDLSIKIVKSTSGILKDEINSKITWTDERLGIFIDARDDRKYKIIKIGNQIWMSENLKATKFYDGTNIPMISDNNAWINCKSAGYCWYNNDANAYIETYGPLYNFYAINTGKLSPKGWHVPNDKDWDTLIDFLGGQNIAGHKLREKGTKHWLPPNEAATNESGFNALPGGYRDNMGTFQWLGESANWWSSERLVRGKSMGKNGNIFYRYGADTEKNTGFSVRCLHD